MKRKNKLLFLATLSTACLLSLASCQGAQGPKGDQGDPGINGTNGTNGKDGEPGKDGSSVLSGKGVPASTLGSDGDSYIDTETFDFYVKASGKWSKEGNIKGAAGDQGSTGEEGAKGEDGTSIRTGKGEPADALGNDGDSYIDLTNFDFYVKEDGEWSLEGNIKGEKGEQGDKGEQGRPGSNGSNGSAGKPGATAWTNTILPSSGGYVTVDKGSAIADGESKVTFTAHPDDDNVVSSFIVSNNGKTVESTNSDEKGKDVEITTTMLAGGFVVSATFLSQEEAAKKNVVLANNKLYDSVNEAISDGCTSIKLLKDATLSDDINIPETASLTIDLNEHELNCGSYQIGVLGELIFVNKDGKGNAERVIGKNASGIVLVGLSVTGSTVKTESSSFKLDSGKFNTITTMGSSGDTTSKNNEVSIGAQVIFSLLDENDKVLGSSTAIKSSATNAKISVDSNAQFECAKAIEVTTGSVTLSGEINATQGTAVSVAGDSTITANNLKVNASGESSKGIEVTTGNVTIQGSVTATSGTAVSVSGGTVNVSATVSSSDKAAINVSGTSTVTVSGTVSTASSSESAINVEGSIGSTTKVKVESSATVENTNKDNTNKAISQTGTEGTVEVTGGDGQNIEVEKKYKITVGEFTGGSISFEGTTFKKDEKVTVTLTPDSLYKVESLTITGIEESDKTISVSKLTEGKDGKYAYELTVGKKDITLSALFKENPVYPTEVNDGSFGDNNKVVYLNDSSTAIYCSDLNSAINAGATEVWCKFKSNVIVKGTSDYRTQEISKNLIIHGNGADFFTNGNCGEISTSDPHNSDNSQYKANSYTVTMKDCNNLKIWGISQNDGVTRTFDLENCHITNSQLKGKVGLFYVSGETGTTDLTIKNCSVKNAEVGLFLNNNGNIKVEDSEFNNCASGIKISHKTTSGSLNVSIKNTKFDNCGYSDSTGGYLYDDRSAIKVKTYSEINLSLENVAITNMIGNDDSKHDIVLGNQNSDESKYTGTINILKHSDVIIDGTSWVPYTFEGDGDGKSQHKVIDKSQN